MGRLIDIAGQRFGRLVALKVNPVPTKAGSAWDCVCDCGTICRVSSQHLRTGHTTSCGCYIKEILMAGTQKTHGLSNKSKTYKTWKCMRARCKNPNDPHWRWYGARGITICKEWDDYLVFLNDMGERPIGKTLDRINNDGNYSKDNCRWATHKEQMANRRKRQKKTKIH